MTIGSKIDASEIKRIATKRLLAAINDLDTETFSELIDSIEVAESASDIVCARDSADIGDLVSWLVLDVAADLAYKLEGK